MGRNIVPRINKDADLGTPSKNWNKLYADAVILRGRDLQALLDGKTDLETLTTKGDLYVATGAGAITRLQVGADGYVLKADSSTPQGLTWGPAGARQELTENITVTVGSGGQFPTINAAIENIVSLYYPKYIANWGCPRVTIQLLQGFVMAEQVLVDSLDLSWITITGDDAETIINRSALTKQILWVYPPFGGQNGGFLPIIDQLFNMDTTGTSDNRYGIFVCANSQAIIREGAGIKNAVGCALYAYDSSIIKANSSVLSSTDWAVYASNGSIINANNCNVLSGTPNGFYIEYGSIISAYGTTATTSQPPVTPTVDGIIFR